ncbi:MAG: mitochondrial fission ELM1 family protein [Alphaproteobacteria bacterium]
MKCWIITEGIAGTENQCIGVAEALGVTPEIKRVSLRQPWRVLSPYLGLESGRIFNPPLLPPWPDILITSGRKSIAAARYIKKASAGKTFTVQIQDPRISPKNFDLVAVPEHDPTRGENVIITAASPNRVTDKKLAEAKEQFRAQFEHIKPPRVAVLIGGNSKSHRLTTEIIRRLAAQLKNLDAGLMITASRRTGEENISLLKEHLSKHPLPDANAPSLSLQGEGSRERDFFFWNGSGDNPYFGMLAWADYILVTADSASMLSDAATTGKPVYMIKLEGGSPRLDKLHENLKRRGIIRDFEGVLEHWTYEPLRDSINLATEIRKRMTGHIAEQV